MRESHVVGSGGKNKKSIKTQEGWATQVTVAAIPACAASTISISPLHAIMMVFPSRPGIECPIIFHYYSCGNFLKGNNTRKIRLLMMYSSSWNERNLFGASVSRVNIDTLTCLSMLFAEPRHVFFWHTMGNPTLALMTSFNDVIRFFNVDPRKDSTGIIIQTYKDLFFYQNYLIST